MGRSEHFATGTQQQYRNTEPVPVEQYGMRRVGGEEIPQEYMSHHALLGPDADKHGTSWRGAPTEVIAPDVEVKTTQSYVGREHVERYMKGRKPNITRPVDFGPHDDEGRGQGEGNPRVAKIRGEYWGIDGHHRLAAARALGRPVKARVYDVDAAIAGQHNTGAAPTTRGDVVNHLYDHHVHDNDIVDESFHDPRHAEAWGGEPKDNWSDQNLRDYHTELHRGGVADHRHLP